jgi:hypothetical protein
MIRSKCYPHSSLRKKEKHKKNEQDGDESFAKMQGENEQKVIPKRTRINNAKGIQSMQK